MLVVGLQSIVVAVARETRERSSRKVRVGGERQRIQPRWGQDLPRCVGIQVDSEMANGVPNVAHLNRIVVGELILRRQVVALRIRRLVVVVLADQGNTSWLHGPGSQRNRRKPVEDGANLPVGESDRRVRSQVGEVEIELKREIVIGQQGGIFESTEEDSVAAPDNQFGHDLIGKTEAWRKIGLL